MNIYIFPIVSLSLTVKQHAKAKHPSRPQIIALIPFVPKTVMIKHPDIIIAGKTMRKYLNEKIILKLFSHFLHTE